MHDSIRFIFRGQIRALKGFAPTRSLLDWLREDQRATGTKEGCSEGDCGACTVVLARVKKGQLVHRPVNACITLLGMVDGAEILTVEDLAEGANLHPVQQAMVDCHGSQCGFCTPGIVMSLFALQKLQKTAVTRQAINDQLSGNLCRCTGYRPIIDAAQSVLNKPAEDHLDRRRSERIKALQALEGGGDNQGATVVAEQGFFAAPRNLEEALKLLEEHPDTTILAGATDVGLWITKQFRPINKIIWLGHVQGLQVIQRTQSHLVIGAGVTHENAMPYLAEISADLLELGRRFGSAQVRTQGTVGGNIANGSPIGDWAPAFIALGAEVTLVKLDGTGKLKRRSMPLEQFFIAYGKQDRERTELVESLSIPHLKQDAHFRCSKISKRFDEDISALMGAFKVTLVKGLITHACIAFGGMAATPKRATKTEAALLGASLSDEASWQPAMDALADDFQPISDMRASSRYRAETASALLQRALMEMAGAPSTRLHGVTGELTHAP